MSPSVIWKKAARLPLMVRAATLSEYSTRQKWHHLGPKSDRISTSHRYDHPILSYAFAKSGVTMTVWTHFVSAKWCASWRKTGFCVMHRPRTKPVSSVGNVYGISLFKCRPYAFLEIWQYYSGEDWVCSLPDLKQNQFCTNVWLQPSRMQLEKFLVRK